MLNCLTYLLNLWARGERFKILYNSDHCISDKGHDFKNTEVGDLSRYIPLEKTHNLETVIKIFELDERFSNLLEEYYLWRC